MNQESQTLLGINASEIEQHVIFDHSAIDISSSTQNLVLEVSHTSSNVSFSIEHKDDWIQLGDLWITSMGLWWMITGILGLLCFLMSIVYCCIFCQEAKKELARYFRRMARAPKTSRRRNRYRIGRCYSGNAQHHYRDYSLPMVMSIDVASITSNRSSLNSDDTRTSIQILDENCLSVPNRNSYEGSSAGSSPNPHQSGLKRAPSKRLPGTMPFRDRRSLTPSNYSVNSTENVPVNLHHEGPVRNTEGKVREGQVRVIDSSQCNYRCSTLSINSYGSQGWPDSLRPTSPGDKRIVRLGTLKKQSVIGVEGDVKGSMGHQQREQPFVESVKENDDVESRQTPRPVTNPERVPSLLQNMVRFVDESSPDSSSFGSQSTIVSTTSSQPTIPAKNRNRTKSKSVKTQPSKADLSRTSSLSVPPSKRNELQPIVKRTSSFRREQSPFADKKEHITGQRVGIVRHENTIKEEDSCDSDKGTRSASTSRISLKQDGVKKCPPSRLSPSHGPWGRRSGVNLATSAFHSTPSPS